eukprot:4629696-Prymnesium_polylepis.1
MNSQCGHSVNLYWYAWCAQAHAAVRPAAPSRAATVRAPRAGLGSARRRRGHGRRLRRPRRARRRAAVTADVRRGRDGSVRKLHLAAAAARRPRPAIVAHFSLPSRR